MYINIVDIQCFSISNFTHSICTQKYEKNVNLLSNVLKKLSLSTYFIGTPIFQDKTAPFKADTDLQDIITVPLKWTKRSLK